MALTNNTQDDRHIQDFNEAMKEIDLSFDDESIPTSTLSEMDDIFTSKSGDNFDLERGNPSQGDDTLRKLPSSHKKQNRYSFCCICSRIVMPVVMISVVIVFSILFFGDGSSLESLMPGMYQSEDFGEQLMWRRSSGQEVGGLTLTVVNALDSTWQTYFDTAVQDWDSGTPDALTLTSQVASAPDPECSIVEGVLKMCNNNFGETGWMGVNNVVQYNDLIAGSAGMMNEYYFGTGDDAKRQYTMCHEMGHGFGLPHTDTLLWNLNKRNCLDYTNRPRTNTRPGAINYKRLADVYGTVDSGSNAATTAKNSTAGGTSENISTQNNANENNGGNGDKANDQKDNEERLLLLKESDVYSGQFPSFVKEALNRLRQRQLTQTFVGNEMDHSSHDGWNRMLQVDGDKYGYELDVGDGYKIQVHYLKAY